MMLTAFLRMSQTTLHFPLCTTEQKTKVDSSLDSMIT